MLINYFDIIIRYYIYSKDDNEKIVKFSVFDKDFESKITKIKNNHNDITIHIIFIIKGDKLFIEKLIDIEYLSKVKLSRSIEHFSKNLLINKKCMLLLDCGKANHCFQYKNKTLDIFFTFDSDYQSIEIELEDKKLIKKISNGFLYFNKLINLDI